MLTNYVGFEPLGPDIFYECVWEAFAVQNILNIYMYLK